MKAYFSGGAPGDDAGMLTFVPTGAEDELEVRATNAGWEASLPLYRHELTQLVGTIIEFLDPSLAAEIRDALEGDSNDAEHDALVSAAGTLGIEYDPDAAS